MEKQQTTIFGIDLGTTFSCIAYVDEYGKATVIPNAEGDAITPSVVLFEGSNRVVGREAKNSVVLSPEHVVSMIKREMGNPDYRFTYDGVAYSPQEISSYILKKLAVDAEQQLGRPVQEVVITCPAYFGLAEREATRKAGELAGFDVREILNEPTAAAIDFGLQNDRDQVVLVYDLGGGTFDVTIIRIQGGVIEVIATGGDHRLGGRDWDELVVKYLAQKWQEANPDESSDPLESLETLQDLWQKAEGAKRALSARAETRVAVVHEGKTVSVTLTREQFDALTESKLEQTIQYTQETLKIAQEKDCGHFDQLLLVGGSTRMPQVKERLMREFPGIEPRMHDPDQAVAKGAAIYGQKLAIGDAIRTRIAESDGSDGSSDVSDDVLSSVANEFVLPPQVVKKLAEIKIVNVASHSFGVIVVNRKEHRQCISNLVLAQTPVPAPFMEVYGTETDNQENVFIQVMQNDSREKNEFDLSLGEQIIEATLGPLPPQLPAGSRIEVTGELTVEGLLRIVARDATGGRSIEVRVEPKGALTPKELEEAYARSGRLQIV